MSSRRRCTRMRCGRSSAAAPHRPGSLSGLERLSPHGLRAGFITEAYRQGARDEEIMDHTRHRDFRTMRGYVRRAKLLSESPVKKLGL
jgi:integrase